MPLGVFSGAPNSIQPQIGTNGVKSIGLATWDANGNPLTDAAGNPYQLNSNNQDIGWYNSLPSYDYSAKGERLFNTALLGIAGGSLAGLAGLGAGAAGAGGAGSVAATAPYIAPGASVAGSALPAAGIGAEGVGAALPAAGAGAAAGATGMPLGLPGWLGIGSNVLGGLLGASAANKATNASTAADQAAIAEIQRQFDLTRQDQAPYQAAGVNALGQLSDPNANFMASPDYAFRRSEGDRGIENQFSAMGGAQSGNALKALADYNSNLASGEFGNWWNRQAGLAGIGQTANAQTGALGANAANTVGNLYNNQGNTRASGILGQYGSLYGGLNNALNNWLYYRRQPTGP